MLIIIAGEAKITTLQLSHNCVTCIKLTKLRYFIFQQK